MLKSGNMCSGGIGLPTAGSEASRELFLTFAPFSSGDSSFGWVKMG